MNSNRWRRTHSFQKSTLLISNSSLYEDLGKIQEIEEEDDEYDSL